MSTSIELYQLEIWRFDSCGWFNRCVIVAGLLVIRSS